MSRPYVFISELPALNSLECYTATAEYRGKQELQEKCRFALPIFLRDVSRVLYVWCCKRFAMASGIIYLVYILF